MSLTGAEFQSTRPLRGATTPIVLSQTAFQFQSTRPLRGATPAHVKPLLIDLFQSTRPLRGATIPRTSTSDKYVISIHAPLAGRDLMTSPRRSASSHFNPRAPCGARPVARGPYHGLYIISIHAPLAGRDVARLAERMDRTYFNPRAPCGARQQAVRYSVSYISFQSTRPLRGATRDLVGCSGRVGISIHAPLAGRDRPGSALQSPCCYFNPRAPCGARLFFLWRCSIDGDFNPRAPCGARPPPLL